MAAPVATARSKRGAAPAQSIGADAEQKRRRAQRQRHDEEVRHDQRAVQLLDVGEPRGGPQALQRPRRPDADRRHRREPPEARVAVDRGDPDHAGGCIADPALRALRHDKHDHDRRDRRHRGEDGEQAAPSHVREYDLGGRRGGDGAQRAQHDEPAVGERDALGREPQHDGLEAGHQGAGDADPDQPAADGERNEPIG
jgi:hypothetical protein